MQFPKRVDNHITETASFKIFSRCIPDRWIIRDITERDYGIDCYIELVNNDNQVSGELISIQLKGTANIEWTQHETYTFSGIKITTSNYWNHFPVPVFICLVDMTKEEVYFCPVRSYIRKEYIAYAKQQAFSYQFNKANRLEKEDLAPFVKSYFLEKSTGEMEKHLVTFISHIEAYKEFYLDNTGRDVFMGIENNRILFLKHFYDNLQFLADYFNVPWDIQPLKYFFRKSREIFGDNYDLYEQQMDEVVTQLEQKIVPILLKVRDHVVDVERGYWIVKDISILNVMINVKNDGRMPTEW